MFGANSLSLATILSTVVVSTASAQGWNPNVVDGYYWWYYPSTDAENEDLRQLPCAHACTIKELTDACAADNACVAFNSNGWLKKSTADKAPDSCDLYIKNANSPQPKPTPTPSPPPPPPISFLPIPISVNFGAGAQTVDPTLTFTLTTASADLQAYADRIQYEIFQVTTPANSAPAGSTKNVVVDVADVTVPLSLGVDESYTIAFPADGSDAKITANTIYGAMMGLQTISQAIRYDYSAGVYSVKGAPLAISDKPKFAWRGILIDTDRHWLSLRHIYRIIDALGLAKLNILHWHIVDWQSWPLESKAYPKLWNAAWTQREMYTLGDVAAVTAYAKARGVRVVPEFDTPGHASSMCVGYPELCCSAACGPQTNNPLSPVPVGGQNVSLNAIQAVLAEIAGATIDEFFHLGGDEVDQTCWQNTPAVQAWMNSNGINSTDGVYEYFVAAVDQMTINLNRSPIRWEEVWKHFGTDLDQRTVIHAWLSSAALIDATSKGYRAIWSVDGLYYLDALSEPWQKFYDVDILAGITNTSAIPLVLGGELEQWGETADGSDVMQTIFPRAAAGAERLWSYDVVTNSSDPTVLPRMQNFRCFMLERGVASAPVNNANAREAPPGPGSCFQ